jgi:hypothetical protein
MSTIIEANHAQAVLFFLGAFDGFACSMRFVDQAEN